jgi:hypothetical protein
VMHMHMNQLLLLLGIKKVDIITRSASARTNGADLMDIDGRSRLARGRTRWRQATPYSLNIVV